MSTKGFHLLLSTNLFDLFEYVHDIEEDHFESSRTLYIVCRLNKAIWLSGANQWTYLSSTPNAKKVRGWSPGISYLLQQIEDGRHIHWSKGFAPVDILQRGCRLPCWGHGVEYGPLPRLEDRNWFTRREERRRRRREGRVGGSWGERNRNE